jgi:2-methylisocitrate lyase-like PEP mutase family enzyme
VDATAFLAKAKESKPRLDEIITRVKLYDKAGAEFLKTMEKCPESVTTGMEILQSVEKITIDSIKTNY